MQSVRVQGPQGGTLQTMIGEMASPGLLRWTRTIPHAARITGHDLLLLGGLNGDRANEARKVKLWPILEVKLWPIWHLYGTYGKLRNRTELRLKL